MKDLGITGGAIVGGLWALRRYWVERTEETALEIGLEYSCIPLSNKSDAGGTPMYLVSFDILLSNRGKIKIQAKPGPFGSGVVAFNDGVEKLASSGSLQLKRFEGWEGGTAPWINWFEDPTLQIVPGLGEVNMLTEYEDPRRQNAIDFWMEPGEACHLGAMVVLKPGVYFAKFTFIGAGGDDEFWSRLTSVQVPKPVTASKAA
ncbi:MAG TPA: hypothetical protein VKE70_31940 [Candidatus Solibacter sp.]|nr:hypothetical protein [Candidatus Solibacter sp.]